MNLSKDYFRWESFLARFPEVHILQSGMWGNFKENFGWDVVHITEKTWGCQILMRRVVGIFRIAYIPKGPVTHQDQLSRWINDGEQEEMGTSLTERLRELCQKMHILFVKIEPDVIVQNQDHLRACPQGLVPSRHSIQPLRTILIDIEKDESEILAKMKQKTRYNIRLAERKGVMVETSDDLKLFYQMIVQTGERDRFSVHSRDYYEKVYHLFREKGQCELFMARYQNIPIAGLMVFAQGNRAFYFYGASTNQYREVMAPYLLQWRAILWAKERGCTSYDLWGVPDYDETFLESQFEKRRDGLWGVYRFKRGFGGNLVRYAGPYDYVASPPLYTLYNLYLQRKRLNE